MSIESNLKTLAENSTRIADALEQLCDRLSPTTATAEAAPVAPKPAAPAAVPTPPPVAPAAPAPVASTAASPSEAPAPAVNPVMTPEQLNAALVAEFQRLGSRDAIDNALKAMGVTGVNELDQSRYVELLNAVKSIQVA